MASPATRIEQPKGAAPRSRDVEALASTLFVHIFLAERGTKKPESAAQTALDAAREFYKVCDQNFQG
jgi:hypothetical protein